jgi:hypothetical protein
MPLQCHPSPLAWSPDEEEGSDGLVGTSLYGLPSGLTRPIAVFDAPTPAAAAVPA